MTAARTVSVPLVPLISGPGSCKEVENKEVGLRVSTKGSRSFVQIAGWGTGIQVFHFQRGGSSVEIELP